MSWFSQLFKKRHGSMIILCQPCARDFFKTGSELGKKDFVNCPYCGRPTPIIPYSPAQAAAEVMARAALKMTPRR